MGEFIEIAERLARRIDESKNEGGIDSHAIAGIVEEAHGHSSWGDSLRINCYPGIPDLNCYDTAWFISLVSSSHTKGKGHLSFLQAMELLIKHMQGHCYGKTKNAILFTDNWEPNVFNGWESNISNIKKDAQVVEVYLMRGLHVSEIYC